MQRRESFLSWLRQFRIRCRPTFLGWQCHPRLVAGVAVCHPCPYGGAATEPCSAYVRSGKVNRAYAFSLGEILIPHRARSFFLHGIVAPPCCCLNIVNLMSLAPPSLFSPSRLTLKLCGTVGMFLRRSALLPSSDRPINYVCNWRSSAKVRALSA